MDNTIGLILAAGRGSRMQGLTEEKPKCLLKLAGKTLLDWQLESLTSAGLKNLLIVCGYKAEILQNRENSISYDTIINTRWAETNMVQSLLSALPKIENKTVLASYSDIVYSPQHIEKLLQCQGDICITYDTQWQELWQLRADNTSNDILADAENFLEENGKLLKIGSHAKSLDDVQGQYMGLLKFSPKGLKIIQDYVHSLPKERADKLDMTSLLSALLEQNNEISTVAISAKWCECDTQEDIEKYEEILKNNPENTWKFDWR